MSRAEGMTLRKPLLPEEQPGEVTMKTVGLPLWALTPSALPATARDDRPCLSSRPTLRQSQRRAGHNIDNIVSHIVSPG